MLYQWIDNYKKLLSLALLFVVLFLVTTLVLQVCSVSVVTAQMEMVSRKSFFWKFAYNGQDIPAFKNILVLRVG